MTMKRIIIMLVVSLVFTIPVTAQIGKLKNLKDKVPSTKKISDIKKEIPPAEQLEEIKSEGTLEVESVTTDAKPQNIRFSTLPINPENPDKLTNEFKTGDYIYAIVDLPEIINKYYPHEKSDKAVSIDIMLYTLTPPPPGAFYKEDRELQLSTTNLLIPPSQRENDYLLLEIAPNPELETVYSNPEMKFREFGKKWNGPAQLALDISTLEPGKNKIKMVVHLRYNPVANGIFNINGDDFQFYAGLSDQLNMLAAEGGASAAQFPRAEKSDPELEKRMIAEFKNSNDYKNGRFNVEEILKIAIYDKDWHIRRHDFTGIILERYIRASIAIKGKDGQCGYYNVTFKQDYVGGQYEPMKYDGSTERKAIKCENLK